ncbi:MAG: hypothetical protein J5644_03750 [Bacteroidales bacterium]|nr:hypothetical protein [Bacteroidales bacterium]
MINLKQIRDADSLAPKNSPVLTGNPKAPTPAQSETETTRIATVGFVRTAVAAGGGGGGGAASLAATDLGQGVVELTAINTSSTLTATDNSNGHVTLSLI